MAIDHPLPFTRVPKNSIPEVGSMPFWQKLSFRFLARLGYGKHAASSLWNEVVQNGNLTLADQLLGAGLVYPRATKRGAYDGLSELLFEAVRYLDEGALTERLLRMGANPNYIHQNNYWDAPSHRAARCRNAPALQAMIRHGADMGLRDGNKFTPALAALSDFGAHTTYMDKPAVTVEERWGMVEDCLRAGADPKAKGTHGQTLLSYALEDIPERLDWVLGLGVPLDNPRQALENVFFSELVGLGDHHAFLREDGLANDRRAENGDFRWPRDQILAILEREGATYTGANEEGRTFLEEGIHRHALRAEDVALLVARGVPLGVRDAAGNTLTHQLLTQQRYANEEGVALYDSLRRAGLPDQRNDRNAAGLTPAAARDAIAADWYVRNARAFNDRLKQDPPTLDPVPPLVTPAVPSSSETDPTPAGRFHLRHR